jgi:flagellar basal body-associated protein FliL
MAAYILGLSGLAAVGYIYADYKVEATRHVSVVNKKFETDVAYVDLPQMNLSIQSGDGASGRVRINISIEVDKKYAAKVEDYAPRITDRIVTYMQKQDFDEINEPHASKWLKPRLVQITNTAMENVPIIDIIFRQFLIL